MVQQALQAGDDSVRQGNFVSTNHMWRLSGSKEVFFTPWKMNMEPTNHPFRKGDDLPNLHDYVPC